MFRPAGLAILLALGLLVERVAAVPTPRSPAAVSFLPRSTTLSVFLNAQQISWGDCGSFGIASTDPNLQCGTLDVPMDYHDNSAGTAHLAVVKYATTASQKLGTVFFNPGDHLHPSFVDFR